jgi:hypothetical protein
MKKRIFTLILTVDELSHKGKEILESGRIDELRIEHFMVNHWDKSGSPIITFNTVKFKLILKHPDKKESTPWIYKRLTIKEFQDELEDYRNIGV